MNDSEQADLKKLVAEIDSLVPTDGAQVQLSQYGGGPDESRVIANQRGYLRLGIEFLKAAFAPHDAHRPHFITAGIRHLLSEDSDIGFDWFERREDLPTVRSRQSRFARFIPFVVFPILFAIAVCALVGFITIIRWLLSHH
jgi:hypothetical protein